jgi:hypothetical protein
MYEWIFTPFGTPFKIIYHNGFQFLKEVVKNLLACLAIKHMFTIIYKPNQWLHKKD